ncbi:MAG: COX15/CtaA family protein [Acidobacteria bacterium]|jgi:heme A synthase|nr:COX15/CtaA family protein [Acidobacteriota bacterium]
MGTNSAVHSAPVPRISHARWFRPYAWFVLLLNLAVILWGAYVRASGSGSGCGDHWPLCNGQVLPEFQRVATVIEFTHRITSAVLVVAVLVLLAAAWKIFPAGHAVRRAALWSVGLTFAEGLFGAALVLLGHVGENTSPWRGVSLTLHLMNTLALIAALASVAWFSRPRVCLEKSAVREAALNAPDTGRLRLLAVLACLGIVLTYTSGGVAALADTLFPAGSLQQGLAQDAAANSHIFLRVRVFHPLLAVLAAVTVIIFCIASLPLQLPPKIQGLRIALFLLVFIQLLAGAMNLALLHPVWMQIVHLGLAASLWICLFLLTLELRAATTPATT